MLLRRRWRRILYVLILEMLLFILCEYTRVPILAHCLYFCLLQALIKQAEAFLKSAQAQPGFGISILKVCTRIQSALM